MKKKILGLCLGFIATCTNLVADDDFNYDYIIVGNGSAGAILARKLSDNHHKKVLVLTTGINHNDDPVTLLEPISHFAYSANLAFDPQFADTYVIQVLQPDDAQTVIYSEGTGWGGGANHNDMLGVRGTRRIYDLWAGFSGNSQWSYNEMLPLMLAMENYNPCQSVANLAERGVGGPISMTAASPVNTDPLGILLEAGTGVGFKSDYNDPAVPSTTGFFNLGVSPAQFFALQGATPCTFGTRSFSSLDFLTPSVVTPTGHGVGGRLLDIHSNCYVTRVILHGNKAEGVEFVFGKNGNKASKAYGKTIILCAGPINSPAILMRSGIGDPAILEPLGIEVVVPSTQVGKNLINQYGHIALANIATTGVAMETFTNATGLAAPFDYPNDDVRRLQWISLPANQAGTISAFFNLLTNPLSLGSLQIVSRNQFVQPSIDLNMFDDGPYTQNGTDANLMMASIKLLANAVGVGNMILPPPATFASDDDLFAYLTSRDGLGITYHIVGTTRMAQSIAEGVVDGNLNVFGVKNLMVADTGVLPETPDGNTCYAAYMVGMRAATILGSEVPPAL